MTITTPAGNDVTGDSWSVDNTGNVTATSFSGIGSGLTGVSASNLTGDVSNSDDNVTVNSFYGGILFDDMASQASSAVAITGGTIDGTTVGASSPSTGAFTSVTIGGGTTLTNVQTGTATLVGGTVTIPAIILGSSVIIVTTHTVIGNQGMLSTGTRTGVDFTIDSSDVGDNSTVDWEVIN